MNHTLKSLVRNYFLQVAQTSGVPWHHRYLATDHPQLISDTFTIMYTNNIIYEGTKWH